MNQSRTGGHVYGLTALVPLAWAVLLLLHPAPDANDIFGSLRQEANAWLIVHRVAIGTFVLFYGAAEAISGVATGSLVRYVSDLPSDGQATAAGVVQALWDDFITGDLLFLIGSVAWIVAVIAAAVAYRQVGAPQIASILLALSAMAVFHALRSARSACCFWRGPWPCSHAANVPRWPPRQASSTRTTCGLHIAQALVAGRRGQGSTR